MNYLARPAIWLLGIGIAVAGCHSAAKPAPEAAAAVAPASAAAPATTPAPAPAQSESKLAPTPDLANPKVATAHVAEFTPPFPERVNQLFEPPKRAQSTVRKDDEHGESVELIGFINVDEPRVILSIDGAISPIPEGGEKYGVRVRSIQPPSVDLERGRNRWRATLE